jgi:tetratricopeptide (TPR) repeat protein
MHRTFLHICVLFGALVGMTAMVPASAETMPRPTAAELDALFAELKSAKSSTEAQQVEFRIWNAWIKSGDAEIDKLVGLAIVGMQEGNHTDALAVLDVVVAKKPDFAEGWNKRATVLYLMGELDRSIADIRHVLLLEPRHFGAISGLGLIEVAKGDPKGAIEAYRKVIEIYPMNSNAQKSIESLEKAVAGEPL